MPLVNIDQWRAEKGFGTAAANSPQAPDPTVDPTAELHLHIGSLEAEVLRQRDLIVQLQAALRTYVEREERAVQAARANRPARTGRVKRRPRPVPPAAPSKGP